MLTNVVPRAERGAIASKARHDEAKRRHDPGTYAGHPLYTWREEKPGQARGRGVKAFDARWYPLRPSGKPIEGI
jgi:predicted lipoprotein with Yx(FWY)xxD motif